MVDERIPQPDGTAGIVAVAAAADGQARRDPAILASYSLVGSRRRFPGIAAHVPWDRR